MLQFKTKTPVVGLDIGAESVRLVQLKAGKGSPKLTAFSTAPLPRTAIDNGLVVKPDEVADVVSQALGLANLNPKRAAVVVGLPINHVFIRQITVPRMSIQELESAMQWEAGRYVPFDISDAIVSYDLPSKGANGQVLDPTSSEMEVLLVAAKKQVVDAYTSALGLIGIKPKVIEVSQFTLTWVVKLKELSDAALDSDTDSPASGGGAQAAAGRQEVGVGFLDIGPTLSNLLITADSDYRMSRTIQVGTVRLVPSQRGPDDPEMNPAALTELSNELKRNIDYYNKVMKGSFTSLYLTGDSARINGLRESLEVVLDSSVQHLRSIRELSIDRSKLDKEELSAQDASLAVAIGLALRGLVALG